MAANESLFVLVQENSRPTASAYARIGTIADASTPASIENVLLFAGATADEHAEWEFEVPSNYAGGGFSFVLKYACTGTSTGAVQFELRMINLADGAVLTNDLGMDTATATDVTDTPGGTANVMNVCAAATVSHANAGSPAAGDRVRIRISRDFDHASNTDDAAFIVAHVSEAA